MNEGEDDPQTSPRPLPHVSPRPLPQISPRPLPQKSPTPISQISLRPLPQISLIDPFLRSLPDPFLRSLPDPFLKSSETSRSIPLTPQRSFQQTLRSLSHLSSPEHSYNYPMHIVSGCVKLPLFPEPW